ncbi:Hypothetical protein FKW44_000107 [Caligus rogercresseyi]|uniref:Uncharacterized protein n=1 Tax=Caligus rogercresseyi TaxID=217165 RepID=A0A7T8QUM4_CALRO|nr:Hypothetical protein FKW44_000107 [Caligus rogercresseyi]
MCQMKRLTAFPITVDHIPTSISAEHHAGVQNSSAAAAGCGFKIKHLLAGRIS